MPAGEFHGMQMHTLFDQFLRYFQAHPHIHVSMDNFIYYREGDLRKVVSPDVYVVLGAARLPLRRSFYTWAEGTVPTAVFEFLSDTTGAQDRDEKIEIYLRDIGVAEYFIHQPDMNRPIEFRGWRRDAVGTIIEIEPDEAGGIFSASLNLHLRWELHEAWGAAAFTSVSAGWHPDNDFYGGGASSAGRATPSAGRATPSDRGATPSAGSGDARGGRSTTQKGSGDARSGRNTTQTRSRSRVRTAPGTIG